MKRDRSRLISTLSPYVSHPVLRRLVDTQEAPRASSERRELTIFFSDIRGFTAWTERVEPDEVAARLNEYFSAMTPVVEKHGGTLDKFIGDCVMVFFGAPEAVEDHAARAVRMAWEMQREVDRLNLLWLQRGYDVLQIGIGIHTAYVTVGNFGSASFLDYTVIGRGVNLAARIESFAPGGRVLISGRTQSLARGVANTRPFAELQLKGIQEPVPVFEVLSVEGGEPAPAAFQPAEWWLVEGTERTGPFPEEGVLAMKQSGRLGPETRVER
jgi:class 3 adenylate cyclase